MSNQTDAEVVRLTHSQAAGLEDAISIVLDMEFECERSIAYFQTRLIRLHETLKILRSSPHAYDAEKAAGLRLSIPRSLNEK